MERQTQRINCTKCDNIMVFDIMVLGTSHVTSVVFLYCVGCGTEHKHVLRSGTKPVDKDQLNMFQGTKL